MIDPAKGPYLFDTSADSYLARAASLRELDWVRRYLGHFPLYLSVISVVERIRGYSIAEEKAEPGRRASLRRNKEAYVALLDSGQYRLVPLSANAAFYAGELMGLRSQAPSPARRSHLLKESRQERLSRWRFDVLIAASALASGLPLVHHNPEDFAVIRETIDRVPQRFPGSRQFQLISVRELTS